MPKASAAKKKTTSSLPKALRALEPLRGKVAVLIPTYNNASTLQETLESIQNQGPVLELFACVRVADDGSRDECVEIARRTWKSDTPLDLKVAPKNRGEATNVTEGALTLPEGVEWFFLMHSDNVAKPGWLETVLFQLLEVKDDVASVSTSWDVWIPGVRTETGDDKGTVAHILGSPATVRDTLFMGCWWHHSTAAIRVEALRSVGGYKVGLRQNTDWDLLIRLLAEGWGIDYIAKPMILYREHEGGVSFGNFKKHRDVWESLNIVRRHQSALTAWELTQFHRIRAMVLFRRMASSVVRGDLTRFFHALAMQAKLPFFYARCLWERFFTSKF